MAEAVFDGVFLVGNADPAGRIPDSPQQRSGCSFSDGISLRLEVARTATWLPRRRSVVRRRDRSRAKLVSKLVQSLLVETHESALQLAGFIEQKRCGDRLRI